MTREEAIDIVKCLAWHTRPNEEDIELAIKALEQQPCEDAISREELLARIDEERKHLLDIKMDGAEHILVHHARRIIEDMQSVTPKPKEAYWIEESNDEYTTIYCYRCSNCGNYNEDDTDYCPDCGCIMTDMRGDENE